VLTADANDSRECSISAEYHNHKEKLKIGSQPATQQKAAHYFIYFISAALIFLTFITSHQSSSITSSAFKETTIKRAHINLSKCNVI
jgi:hypothetical protein